MATREPLLDRLFVVTVRKRLINNTPFDVYKLASSYSGGSSGLVDLRRNPAEIPLPPSREVFLFLETAGTWMCFDWDIPRMADAVARLLRGHGPLTVVGPQASALREKLGISFRVVSTLSFEEAIRPGFQDSRVAISHRFVASEENTFYSGEFYDGSRLTLKSTFSVYHSMNCPMTCSFCFYSPQRRHKQIEFSELLADMERIIAAGQTHFYFMDPIFLLNETRYGQLLEFREALGVPFTYSCQLSPNLLEPPAITRLQATGCQVVIVGIENQELIASKGTVARALDGVSRLRDLNMMPMLFFLIDGKNDVERLLDEFRGCPFRYGLLNRAFASDLSLASIERGFEEKRRLADENRALIERLQQAPGFLGRLAPEPEVDASSAARQSVAIGRN